MALPRQSRAGAADAALLLIRIAVGLVFIVYGFGKVTHLGGVIATWHRLRLPAASLMGPLQAVVEFCGGIFLVAGLLTRLCGALLALDMIGALLIVRMPHTPFQGGYALEWQAFMISLALAVAGAGAYSVDRSLGGAGRRRARSVAG
jgi:putative oxidoreductase